MSSRSGWGQRRIRITPEAIEALLVNENRLMTNFPDDSRFVRLWPEDVGRGYFFVFESEQWDELSEGEEIPEYPFTLK